MEKANIEGVRAGCLITESSRVRGWTLEAIGLCLLKCFHSRVRILLHVLLLVDLLQ